MNSYDNGSSYPADYFAVKRCLVDSECIKMCSEKIEQMISEEILKPEKLPVLPPGVSRGAFMVVQFKNRMYYYTNKIVQEHLYSVESLPVNAQFLEIVCLITPLCVFPEMSLAELQDLRSGLFSEKVLKKVNSFEENLFSDKDHQFTVYIYDATGIHGQVIYSARKEICMITDGIYPVSYVTVSCCGKKWESTFDLQSTIVPGMKRTIKDAVSGAVVNDIIYHEAGHYTIGEHLEIFCDKSRYVYYLDGEIIAYSRKEKTAEWIPKIDGCTVSVSAVTGVRRTVPEDVKLLILSFPALRLI